MNQWLKKFVIVYAATASVACGVEPPVSEGSAPEHSVAAAHEVIDSFSTGWSVIELHRLVGSNGEEVVMVSETGSVGVPGLVDRLAVAHADLTSLEIYHALRGTEVPAPTALLEAHAREVALMGRGVPDVRRVAFDRSKPIEKLDYGTCMTAIGVTVGGGATLIGGRVSVDEFTHNCLGGPDSCVDSTTALTRSAVCNDSNSTISERNAYRFPGGAWQHTSWGSLGVNAYRVWYMPAGAERYYSADGNSTAGKFYHSAVAAFP